jgi:hypothetical protein
MDGASRSPPHPPVPTAASAKAIVIKLVNDRFIVYGRTVPMTRREWRRLALTLS